MRILHLPTDVASQISAIVRGQRRIGLDARGIVVNPGIMQAAAGLRAFDTASLQGHPLRAAIAGAHRWVAIAAAIRWADVIHWHFDGRTIPGDLDLKLAAALNKARLVEFWGSDIRIPEIAVRDNPYLAKLLAERPQEYPISYRRSRTTQACFARHGFACVAPGPELPAYVQRDLFPSPYRAEAVLNLEEFTPDYPDPSRRRPVVVHAPSHLSVKGTAGVMAAVEQLKLHYDFEFRLIHNVPRSEALSIVRGCDVLLDQFVIGAFGTAALEAMALGKPAVCYLSPAVVANLPPDAPYVNASQSNLVDVVGALLADGAQRQELGRRGRAYVEQHHDATVVARNLATIYEALLAKNRKGQRGSR